MSVFVYVGIVSFITVNSWSKKKIRFNAKDVVEPQQSNRIDE